MTTRTRSAFGRFLARLWKTVDGGTPLGLGAFAMLAYLLACIVFSLNFRQPLACAAFVLGGFAWVLGKYLEQRRMGCNRNSGP